MNVTCSEKSFDETVITEVDVDGILDRKGVRYLGNAVKQSDGTWKSLADVGGALCVVQCNITFERTSSERQV